MIDYPFFILMKNNLKNEKKLNFNNKKSVFKLLCIKINI